MDEEALYDRYLDLCLRKNAPAPGDFLKSHSNASDTLRERLESLYRMRAGTQSSAKATSDPSLPVAQLGDFLLRRRIGEGSMGTVYWAEQITLQRPVALKLLRPELQSSKTAAERFRREGRAIARLRHPNIVSVFATGEQDGMPYIAMELVEGQSLRDLLANSKPSTAELVGWIRDIALALQYSHEAGIVHRDVKPANLRITPDRRPLLVDFGIARDMAGADATLTQTFAGTPYYAAPEQVTGRPIDGRTDVYGLAATLYRGLTGRPPVSGDTYDEVMIGMLATDPIPLRKLDPALPRDLEIAVMKALEKDPEERYASARAFATDLNAVLALRPIAARAPTMWSRARRSARRHPRVATGMATAVLAMIIGLSFFVWRSAQRRATRENEALAAVRRADEAVNEYREQRTKHLGALAIVRALRKEQDFGYYTADQDAALYENEQRLIHYSRRREETFYEVLDLLRGAERLHAEVAGTDAVRLKLFREKWEESRVASDVEAERHYRKRILALDTRDDAAADLDPLHAITLLSEPPGARVSLHRLRELSELNSGAERRFVPVPFPVPNGTPVPEAVEPGASVLRVVSGHDELARDDLIVALDGVRIDATHVYVIDAPTASGLRPMARLVQSDDRAIHSMFDADESSEATTHRFVQNETTHTVRGTLESRGIRVGTAAHAARPGRRAIVWRNGAMEHVTLPEGVAVRASVAPVWSGDFCAHGTTPLTLHLGSGPWIAVLDAPGRETVRYAFSSESGAPNPKPIPLPRRGTTPAGWVYMPPMEERSAHWIMDHEVTCAAYLRFLIERKADVESSLWPRAGLERVDWWHVAANGKPTWPSHWRPDWPVLGVSWDAAVEFARWKTENEEARGGRFRFRLATEPEWFSASGNQIHFRYPFGNRFHPKWVKSCFSRPRATPEPVLRFVRDESIYGVFDMAGSAYEWLDAWYDKPRGLRRLGGCSWARADREQFRGDGGFGFRPSFRNGETGFRLCMDAK